MSCAEKYIFLTEDIPQSYCSQWIARYMKSNIIFTILRPHSSHLTQPLDVEVFGP